MGALMMVKGPYETDTEVFLRSFFRNAGDTGVVDSKRNMANCFCFHAVPAQHLSHEPGCHQHHAYLIHTLLHIGRSGGQGAHKGSISVPPQESSTHEPSYQDGHKPSLVVDPVLYEPIAPAKWLQGAERNLSFLCPAPDTASDRAVAIDSSDKPAKNPSP